MALICSELELLMTTSQTLLLLQLILSNKSFLYLKVESCGLLYRAFKERGKVHVHHRMTDQTTVKAVNMTGEKS